MASLSHLQPESSSIHFECPDHTGSRIQTGVLTQALPHGVIYKTAADLLFMPTDLRAFTDAFTRPPAGSSHLIAQLSSIDPETGLTRATRRGATFITGVFEAHLPGCVSGAWVGASNSWGIVKMPQADKTAWLEHGGMKIRAMQSILGLKRLSVFQSGIGPTPDEREANEFRHLISSIWSPARIVSFGPDATTLRVPANSPSERAALSVLQKIHPEMRIHLIYR